MTDLKEMGKRAVAAKYMLQTLSDDDKNKALTAAADGLLADAEAILGANKEDMQAGQENGMHEGLLDRLRLTMTRIEAMALGLRQVAELPDPVGKILEEWRRPNGLRLRKVSVQIGRAHV